MKLLLLKIVLAVFIFIAPALYASTLVLFESIFGETVYIHVAVFIVSILSILYASYIIIKTRS
jgi:hypothetical protein